MGWTWKGAETLQWPQNSPGPIRASFLNHFIHQDFNNLNRKPGKMKTLEDFLQESAATHQHLCPRQVLGARMGMLAGEILGLNLPQKDKRLLVIAETDGCSVDGISASTGCYVGRRTLRIEDYGKVAAVFVDTLTENTIRLLPRPESRTRASLYAPNARNAWETQLIGYQHMPAEELLTVQHVRLRTPLAKILSRPGAKAICTICGEEIKNERELHLPSGQIACRACAGYAYYEQHNQHAEQLSQILSV
jgi:formylmethanofuran dehydrogenase subunit E